MLRTQHRQSCAFSPPCPMKTSLFAPASSGVHLWKYQIPMKNKHSYTHMKWMLLRLFIGIFIQSSTWWTCEWISNVHKLPTTTADPTSLLRRLLFILWMKLSRRSWNLVFNFLLHGFFISSPHISIIWPIRIGFEDELAGDRMWEC